MTRENVLDEAKKCVCGQREQDYGSPESNFGIIADLWSAYTGHTYTPIDVANMMILLKLARIKNGGGTGDSFVDIAGYAACGGEIHSEQRVEDKRDDPCNTCCFGPDVFEDPIYICNDCKDHGFYTKSIDMWRNLNDQNREN